LLAPQLAEQAARTANGLTMHRLPGLMQEGEQAQAMPVASGTHGPGRQHLQQRLITRPGLRQPLHAAGQSASGSLSNQDRWSEKGREKETIGSRWRSAPSPPSFI
jgi:hypothetical protein